MDMPTLAAIRRPLRISLVTETYLPEVNGVAMTLGELVRGMRDCGHTIELVRPRQFDSEVPCERPRFEEFLVRGIALPKYDVLKLGRPCAEHLMTRWKWKRPDVVHIATEGPLGWSALSAAQRLGLPVTTDFHTNFHSYTSHYGVAWLKVPVAAYLRHFHNKALCTMVPTDELKAELEALRFKRLVVVARGVDTTLFNPSRRDPILRKTWQVEDDDPVLLSVGRVAPEKNLDLALSTFHAVRTRVPRAKLVVVGDGPARAELQARAADVIFSGARHGVDLAAQYASADVFLFPSMTETYGNVAVEALASGLAVVAYKYAAPAQHIRDDVNGITVAFGDRAAFIDAATALAADPRRIARYREEARRSMEGLAWTEIVTRFESAIFESLDIARASDIAVPA